MQRSRRYALVSFCLLAQGVRAQGLVRNYPATVIPLIDELMSHQYNIWQMPCPELFFDSLQRRPCGKNKYDTPSNRKEYQKIAAYIGRICRRLEEAGNQVDFIFGVERSPSCAVSKLTAPGNGRQRVRIVSGQGIFIEELKKTCNNCSHRPLYVGIDTLHMNETMRIVRRLMEEHHG